MLLETLEIPTEKQTKIHFDPEPHKYYDDNGLVYTSVTTLIGNYHKPFNKRYWSMYVALRDSGFRVRPDLETETYIIVNEIKRHIDDLYEHPVNVEQVKSVVGEWRRLTEIACERGNTIHDSLENDINKSKGDVKGETNKQIKPLKSLEGHLLRFDTVHDLEATGIQDRWPTIYLRLKYYIDHGCTIFAEKRIYSTSFQIAGMIDVLIVKGKYFAILDWKTNKDELHFVAGYYKKVLSPEGVRVKTSNFIRTYKKMYEPIHNLEDCKGIKYSLQLNTYAKLMIRWGYKPIADHFLTICHIRPNEKPEFIKIDNFLEETELMLRHHYYYNVLNNKKKPATFGINRSHI